MSPMRSANAPTNAPPEAASPAVNSAPACCEPTWLLRSWPSGSVTRAVPGPTSSTCAPTYAANGTIWLRPAASAS